MKKKTFYILGLVILIMGAFANRVANAQTTTNGPYYANPSWDQKLECDTQVTCPRFIVLSNWDSAAVLDRETGLVWEKSPSTSTFPWSSFLVTDAAHHCNDLNLGNRKGWRLPTVQELVSLVDPSVDFQGLTLPAGHPFLNVQSLRYWSATTVASNTDLAWFVIFTTGGVGGGDNKKNSTNLVWCVRGGQVVDPQ